MPACCPEGGGETMGGRHAGQGAKGPTTWGRKSKASHQGKAVGNKDTSNLKKKRKKQAEVKFLDIQVCTCTTLLGPCSSIALRTRFKRRRYSSVHPALSTASLSPDALFTCTYVLLSRWWKQQLQVQQLSYIIISFLQDLF